ncbi:hypothetical protein, partial [Klebsiella pneumoniae]|uniref:hypothetical protein n=1 Tax=Klebsiella pneumoniae TaxID=573 RepID=UPI001F03A656
VKAGAFATSEENTKLTRSALNPYASTLHALNPAPRTAAKQIATDSKRAIVHFNTVLIISRSLRWLVELYLFIRQQQITVPKGVKNGFFTLNVKEC